MSNCTRDTIENVVLDVAAGLGELRREPVVELPEWTMQAGSFDEWRDVEFDAVGNAIDPPTFTVAATAHDRRGDDEGVVAGAVQAVFDVACTAPHEADAVVRAALIAIRGKFLAHRLHGVVGPFARADAAVLADAAFERAYLLADHMIAGKAA